MQSDVNNRDSEGKTPLHKAVRDNNKEMVERLIAKGANINARDKDGETPLKDAISWN